MLAGDGDSFLGLAVSIYLLLMDLRKSSVLRDCVLELRYLIMETVVLYSLRVHHDSERQNTDGLYSWYSLRAAKSATYVL